MYVYSMLPEKINEKLESLVGVRVAANQDGTPPAVTVIMRRNRDAGVDDPVPYITNPETTVVIAGVDDEEGEKFGYAAVAAGVAEENVFLLPRQKPVLSVGDIAKKVKEILEKAEKGDENALLVWDETPVPEPGVGRVKVVGIAGFRGGVGRTTLAASLAAHFTDIGERVAVLDLGSPPSVYRHLGVQPTEKDGWLCAQAAFGDVYTPPCSVWELSADRLAALVNDLRVTYRRTVVDFPAELREPLAGAVNPDKLVVVVDSDVVQSVEPAANLSGSVLYVYNKAVPEVDPEVVSAVLGTGIVVIKNDIDGCYAALAAGEPAYLKSEAVARGTGELAAKL